VPGLNVTEYSARGQTPRIQIYGEEKSANEGKIISRSLSVVQELEKMASMAEVKDVMN
jgi:hypothetical protein